MIILRGIVVWLIFIAAESLNGTIRTLWLVPALGDFWAHQISFMIGSLLVLAIATLFIRWLQASSILQLIGVGILWLLLTVVFEIVLGRFIFAYSWERIAADYNLLKGGLSPVIAAKIRGVSTDQSTTR